jgi:hypothetical protein
MQSMRGDGKHTPGGQRAGMRRRGSLGCSMPGRLPQYRDRYGTKTATRTAWSIGAGRRYANSIARPASVQMSG